MRKIDFRAYYDKRMWEVTNINFNTGNVWIKDKIGIHIIIPLVDCHLMQFIGLSDKLGKEIYEGDIIEYLKVSEGAIPVRKAVKFEQRESYTGYGIYRPHHYKVIGNIYENPELLKEITKK